MRGLTWLVAGVALAFPALTRSVFVWLSLAGLVLARLIVDWPLSAPVAGFGWLLAAMGLTQCDETQ